MPRRVTVFSVLVSILTLASPSLSLGAPAPSPIWLGILRLVPRLHDDAAWTDADKSAVGAHFARLKTATVQGTVILAGRTEEAGDRTLGLVIFKAPDAAAAETFMREDPAVVAQVMTTEVRAYSLALLRDPGRVAAGDDAAVISQPAIDYALGWYEGDATRMERALHPELAKREVAQRANGPAISSMGALRLIQGTRAGIGKKPEGERRMDIRILDRWQDMAMVRLELTDGVDYFQVARTADGTWQIVNVLWQNRRLAEPATVAKP